MGLTVIFNRSLTLGITRHLPEGSIALCNWSLYNISAFGYLSRITNVAALDLGSLQLFWKSFQDTTYVTDALSSSIQLSTQTRDTHTDASGLFHYHHQKKVTITEISPSKKAKMKAPPSSATKKVLRPLILIKFKNIAKRISKCPNIGIVTYAGIEPAISWFVVKRLAIGPAGLLFWFTDRLLQNGCKVFFFPTRNRLVKWGTWRR